MIRSIETRYKGYRFRSRLEARWAVYLDAIPLAWEYEKEGFHLPSGLYLPDFWLPEVRMWAEVKPEFDESSQHLCEELANASGYPCLMLNGTPEAKCYYAVHPSGDPPGVIDYLLDNCYVHESRLFCSPGDDSAAESEQVRYAVEASRAARFEHGETPAIVAFRDTPKERAKAEKSRLESVEHRLRWQRREETEPAFRLMAEKLRASTGLTWPW